MELLEAMTVKGPGQSSEIRLLKGDLSSIPPDHGCDVLVVSAFPNDYAEVRGTLIAALAHKEVSVGALAQNKEIDLRDVSHCWLSHPLDREDLHIGRILCFEPERRGRAAELVGGVFRSLFPFVASEPWVRRIAMPLLASGQQGQPEEEMLRAMLDAAVHWSSVGMEFERLEIVLWSGKAPASVDRLRRVFATIREGTGRGAGLDPALAPGGQERYDLFISYSHQDASFVTALRAELQRLSPGLRVFIDSSSLVVGAAWQQRVYQALEASERVLCLYSPEYLTSKPCLEELHLAILLNRERDGLLVPAYLRSATLPAYMRLIQYHDIREGDPSRASELARWLLDLPTALKAKTTHETPRIRVRQAAEGTDAHQLSLSFSEIAEQLTEGGYELHVEATVRLEPRT